MDEQRITDNGSPCVTALINTCIYCALPCAASDTSQLSLDLQDASSRAGEADQTAAEGRLNQKCRSSPSTLVAHDKRLILDRYVSLRTSTMARPLSQMRSSPQMASSQVNSLARSVTWTRGQTSRLVASQWKVQQYPCSSHCFEGVQQMLNRSPLSI